MTNIAGAVAQTKHSDLLADSGMTLFCVSQSQGESYWLVAARIVTRMCGAGAKAVQLFAIAPRFSW